MPMKEGLKELISNKNYVLLFFSYILIYGVHCAIGAVYSNLAGSYGYSFYSNSICCLIYLVGGILNSFVFGSILDKYQNYRKLVILINILAIVTNLLHSISLPLKNPFVEAVCMLLLGFSLVPMVSVGFAFSVELAFPVPEAITNGMMLMIGLVWGTVMSFICSILQSSSGLYALALWLACSIISLMISIFIK